MVLSYLVVENFRLTDKIVFPKIPIYLSLSLKSTSVLGMDILTMFTFTYRNNSKTITLYYPENYLDVFRKKMCTDDKEIIRPECIGTFDETNIKNMIQNHPESNNIKTNKQQRKPGLTAQDLVANYVNNLVKNNL